MKSTSTRLIPLALLAAALAACASQTTGPLIPAPTPYIADVPIPAGFYIQDDSQTTYNAASQFRMAHHHYRGDDDYLAVAAFYREQLPLKGWTLLSQQHDGKTITLTLSKPNESLVVAINAGTFYTHIHVNLDPLSRGPAATPTPPQ